MNGSGSESYRFAYWDGNPLRSNLNPKYDLKELDSHFGFYQHITSLPRPDEGLAFLRKVASTVKPLMRKRGWRVETLAEFLPNDEYLLGKSPPDVDDALRYMDRFLMITRSQHEQDDAGMFYPFDFVVDSMLHELSHVVFGPHDENFHTLWNELRGELETLQRGGYTGEGFLSEGHRLGGGRVPPLYELQRRARAEAAEKRKKLKKTPRQKLGGRPVPRGADVNKVIADAAIRRTKITNGCASGTKDASKLMPIPQNVFRTKAEEDDANDRAIAEALMELMEHEEEQRLAGAWTLPSTGGLGWSRDGGLYTPDSETMPSDIHQAGASYLYGIGSEEEQLKWALAESARAMATPSGPAQSERPSTEAAKLSLVPPARQKPTPPLAKNIGKPWNPSDPPRYMPPGSSHPPLPGPSRQPRPTKAALSASAPTRPSPTQPSSRSVSRIVLEAEAAAKARREFPSPPQPAQDAVSSPPPHTAPDVQRTRSFTDAPTDRSPSGNVRPLAASPAFWSCDICTFDNVSAAPICAACDVGGRPAE
ncbi:hypothetical protein B0A49_01559 [Cryomyces minteri]|uniref:WLM domain-containing protein n=1 Tax=Cryomyces minteri TaxID=331657 RepID=A0A4V5NJG4_9PEZI|nr:hypothetical protein B0A49_01559 [Cryomyces minteri]